MELGARSLDILIALLSRPNEAISKRDLAQVWPDAIAEEGSLWFQIAKLRSRLRQNKNIIAIR
jgi:DNA-binding winged helix-turn-helix (wHTH) protein